MGNLIDYNGHYCESDYEFALISFLEKEGWTYLSGKQLPRETKKDVLYNFGISNVYRDAINNEDVYFVAEHHSVMLQTYIQENYDPNAYLVPVRVVDSVEILRVYSNN